MIQQEKNEQVTAAPAPRKSLVFLSTDPKFNHMLKCITVESNQSEMVLLENFCPKLFSLRFGQKFGFANSRILPNLKSAVGQRSTSFQEFVGLYSMCLSKLQGPPVQSHSFLAAKVTCSMIYIKWYVICIRPVGFFGLWPNFVTHFRTAKDWYNASLALHLKVLLFLLYNDDMAPFQPLFPTIIIYKHTQLIGKIWRWGEEPKGPFPKVAHQNLRTVQGF
jgi:hypothetical protein